MFEHVIVGVDGGEGSRDAIALARILRAPDAEPALAYVYRQEPLAGRGPSAACEAAERDRARELPPRS